MGGDISPLKNESRSRFTFMNDPVRPRLQGLNVINGEDRAAGHFVFRSHDPHKKQPGPSRAITFDERKPVGTPALTGQQRSVDVAVQFVNYREQISNFRYHRRPITCSFSFTSRTFLRGTILSNVNYMGWLRSKVGCARVLSPSVGAVIHDHEGRLLLQEKASGEAWSLPAGGVELGESPQEAIVREVMEETGYTVLIHGILGVFGGMDYRYTYPSGDHVEYVVVLFQCKIIGGSGIPTDAETKSIRYFGRHDMPELALPYPKDDLFRAF